MRLSHQTLDRLPREVERFAYDRQGQAIGIVHFGIGAFHRAHMAWYTDARLDAGEKGWMICGVSLRSRAVAEQLVPQDGLYTLTERSGAAAATRVIGAVREVLYAPEAAAAIIARIAAPECRIVSFTVTEKGYARGAGGSLDQELAERSFYPLLAAGLAQRKAEGRAGVTLLSCDNLAHNGSELARLMGEWLAPRDPDLHDWFRAHCTCPAAMIDRIVPRTTDADRIALGARIGMDDHGAVFAERFSQWVIEDRFAAGRPEWEAAGAELVGEVAPYETAKLRMLNGAHSLLAYCGLQRGLTYVHEAVADPGLRALAGRLMREEAMPTIAPAPGQALDAYADQLLDRFADPALNHRLAQIAMDGTQKLPQRWLDTVLAQSARGGAVAAIRAGFAAWLWHLEDGRYVDDPFGAELRALMASGGAPAVIARCFVGGASERPLWPGYDAARAALTGS